jgi:hypothetical protein
MGLAATRRAFGALVAIAIALLPALVQPITAGAAGTGTLYGFATGPTSRVVSIDPVTGALTTAVDLSSVPGGVASGVNSLAVDPATRRVFIPRRLQDLSVFPIRSTFQLVTSDMRAGTSTVSSDLSSSLSAVVFDSSSSTLYGISGDKHVVRVDPATGVFTNLAAFSADDVTSMVLAPASHTLYLSSVTINPRTSRLLTMDTVSNVLAAGPVLTPPIRVLEYDTSLGALFGLTFCCPARLVQIDLSSGAGAAFGLNPPLGLGAGVAIDSASHTVFVQQDLLGAFAFNQYIASINDQSGIKVLSGPLPSTSYVSTLLFVPQSDTSPPATSIGLVPAPNAAGWNNTNVTVNLSATDPDGVADVATINYSATGAQTIAPTVVAGSAASFVVNTEGVTTVTYFAKDKAGNTEAAHTKVIRIDKTLPTVTYTGNAGTYTVDQTVTITCTAADPNNANGTAGSGLASTTCANVNAPAYSFPLGLNTLSASATDVAGNLGTGFTTFTVQVTNSSLCTLTVRFIQGSPNAQTSPALAEAQAHRLCKLLANAGSVRNPEAKDALVGAYQNGLTSLVDMGLLTPAQAAILFTLSQAL